MQRDIELEATLVAKFVMVSPELNERGRRVWAATESLAIGYGGDAVVSSATGLARETIRKGRDEIVRGVAPAERLRRPGAGRPRIQTTQPGITAALEALVDPLTRGDPTSPLRWTCKSRAKLAAALTQRGWRVSSTTVGRLLRKLGYSLQAAQKRREGTAHPDRNAQFEYINATAVRFLRRRQPVISVDTKKKELVGQFKNAGREWQPTGQPEAVLVHDFPTDACGKAIPYGVYDMTRNEAWVSVGCDHDTPAFATSKWNKIEHRLFCHITENWRGKPLTTFETIVDLIGHTRTAAGLRVKAKLDTRTYPTGVPVSRAQMDTIALLPDTFHGEWNYELLPR